MLVSLLLCLRSFTTTPFFPLMQNLRGLRNENPKKIPLVFRLFFIFLGKERLLMLFWSYDPFGGICGPRLWLSYMATYYLYMYSSWNLKHEVDVCWNSGSFDTYLLCVLAIIQGTHRFTWFSIKPTSTDIV